jgi:hypothetical protein
LIQNWEVWNEPNASNYWQGTTAQLVRMQQDAYAIIKQINPSLLVASPPPSQGGDPAGSAVSWMTSFLEAGGKGYFDILGFHGYLLPADLYYPGGPELLATQVTNWQALLSAQGISGTPLWDTEGSWQQTVDYPDADMQASFVARFYLLQAQNVARVYWYSYDDPGDE